MDEFRLTCSGPGCIYERDDTEVNGTPVHTENLLDTLQSVAPLRVTVRNGECIELPNHSALFWTAR